MSRLFYDSFRSSGLGKVAKHATKIRKHTSKRVVKSNKAIVKRVKSRMSDADKMRVYDKLSATGKAAMMKSDMTKQMKANKKKYGYEYAKPINLDKYSTKATKQRNRLAPAKPKYNKWGDRVA